jgi:hypothetical protein
MRRRSRKRPVDEQCHGTGCSYPEHDVPDHAASPCRRLGAANASGGPSRDGRSAVWDELARVGVGVIDNEGKGCRMTQGKERTKEQLMREAKKLGIKGRSKMNKGALKAAVDRRS